MILPEVVLLPLSQIKVKKRQRHEIKQDKVEELALSISARDLIHTILVEIDTMDLVVGEHRLEAFKLLKENKDPCLNPAYNSWELIPCRFAKDVTEAEIAALELEENIKRNQLKWDEEALAINAYHMIKQKDNEDWTVTQTSKELGMSCGLTSRYITVAKEIIKGNQKINSVAGITAAYNIISRENERAIDNEINTMEESFPKTIKTVSEVEDIELDEMEDLAPPKIPNPISQGDFIEFVSAYSGPKFNVLHCDFPYGINHQKSEQGRSQEWGAYEDSEEIYWNLCSALAKNLNKILYPSAHILFWFSMKYYHETIDFFERNTDLNINSFPLIWHKSDNKGLLPDPNRGPRRVYETAFLMSRNDRKIIRPVSNLYAAPGTKNIHLSEKSESMLRHFFRMLIDQDSEVFDPTAGSGSALRAADSLGAKRIVGLELDPEHVKSANQEIQRARTLARMSKGED